MRPGPDGAVGLGFDCMQTLFSTAVLAVATTGVLSAQSPPPSTETALAPSNPAAASAEGVRDFNARQPQLARQQFESALAIDSTSYEANWRLALTLITLGSGAPDSIKSPERDSLFVQAERLARRAVAADSLGADGHFLLARDICQIALTNGK